MEELREQDRFDYEQEKDGEGERSLMERFRAFLRDLFYSEGEEQLDPRRILTWIMMILALILVARFLWKNGGAYLFHRDPKVPVEERPFSALTRDRSIDPMERVREAEAEGNFIEAVRWYYISILRQLDEKGLIRQRSYRTDREYLQELRNSGYEEAFERLSRFFHLVRYGDRPLDESSYRYWAERFKELQKRIGHAS